MLTKLLEKYRNTTDLNRFIIKGGSLFFVWRVFRKWMLLVGQDSLFTQAWAEAYLKIADFVLRIAGYETFINLPMRKLWIAGADQAIEVVYDCLGINLFFIFMIFIVAYPGRIRTKAWFIPAGISVIFFLNALRMGALAVVAAFKYQQLDLYHHFIFQGVIYLAIFAMWWIFTLLRQK